MRKLFTMLLKNSWISARQLLLLYLVLSCDLNVYREKSLCSLIQTYCEAVRASICHFVTPHFHPVVLCSDIFFFTVLLLPLLPSLPGSLSFCLCVCEPDLLNHSLLKPRLPEWFVFEPQLIEGPLPPLWLLKQNFVAQNYINYMKRCHVSLSSSVVTLMAATIPKFIHGLFTTNAAHTAQWTMYNPKSGTKLWHILLTLNNVTGLYLCILYGILSYWC